MISKMFKILFLLSSFVAQIYCARRFLHGRDWDGNLGVPAGHEVHTLPQAQWFQQKLDHGSKTDLRTWKQRYFVNDSFYNFDNPGPVFLMIGGEGPADARWMIKGAWIEYAKMFKALCLNLEHRYYGKSYPTSDLSVKNLQYLSSEQALADLANFIGAMNDKYKLRGVKWIAFGGSYPGSLAAWLRLKYPHLIHAAVSSSGPLLAQLDFKSYFEVVVNALIEKTGSNQCVKQVTEAHQQIVKLIKTNPNVIEEEFKVCKPFSSASQDDMRNFYNSIADDFAGVVQYNEDNRISSDSKSRNVTINTICSLLTENNAEPAFKKLARFNAIVLDQQNQTCLDYSYRNMIKDLRNVTLSLNGSRQWMYQTCTEFGFYQTSSGETDVFGNEFPVDFYVKQCQDVFGSKFNRKFIEEGIRSTNLNYGAKNISTSRVVFVHGSVDPWHALGITQSHDQNMPAIYIKGTAHCANMYPPSSKDSYDLVTARITIANLIRKWLV